MKAQVYMEDAMQISLKGTFHEMDDIINVWKIKCAYSLYEELLTGCCNDIPVTCFFEFTS
jgi:hypothetical protein